ncbi:unnamed protein product [Chondrus crispus]|uniref:RlpA-like protein double-psi beta-barrel domain-containing protein n=1 Tax=Chondrus crispus TaxID=2769 RepID=R7QUC3_CHOCR|nr:unnamed protein product [Chondrus crispus]CDF41071.1 unnamed protein product [Chondrus crispus]|eukprot:XP_005711365.1 unnamed protein product [Chondrus crispus]
MIHCCQKYRFSIVPRVENLAGDISCLLPEGTSTVWHGAAIDLHIKTKTKHAHTTCRFPRHMSLKGYLESFSYHLSYARAALPQATFESFQSKQEARHQQIQKNFNMRTVGLFCIILLTGLAAGFEGDLTYYFPSAGTSACGRDHSDLDFVVALSPEDFIATLNPNESPSCQQCVLITGPTGATVKVQVTDKCPGCVKGALDVSPAAFDVIAHRDVGRIRVSWEYVPCDGDNQGTMRQAQVASNGVRQVSPASLVGYYAWTWQSTSGLSDATMSVAFSGWTDVQNALRDSGNVYDSLKGANTSRLEGETKMENSHRPALQASIRQSPVDSYLAIPELCTTLRGGTVVLLMLLPIRLL